MTVLEEAASTLLTRVKLRLTGSETDFDQGVPADLQVTDARVQSETYNALLTLNLFVQLA